jgi:hypothetical protein
MFWSRTARAEANCDSDGEGTSGPIVVVAFSGEPWDEKLERGVLDHLRAGLEPAGFRVCRVGTAAKIAPVATVELRQRSGERVSATIEVRDGVTAKRVARDIDLGALPEDGRALGVGVAADELLRASWVELSLTDAPKPAQTPPPAVVRAVKASLERRAPENELGLRGASSGSAGGLVLFGADIAFRHWVTPGVGVEVGALLGKGLSVRATSGDIAATAFGVEAVLLTEIARAGHVRVHAEAGVWAAELRFHGEAKSASSQGSDGADVAVLARAGAGLTYTIGAFAVALRGGASVAARRVTARDQGAAATGSSGLGWYFAMGPGVVF